MGRRKFQCDICKKKYTRKDNCVTHILEVHAGKKKECKDCGLTMRSTSLIRHRANGFSKPKRRSKKKPAKEDENKQGEEDLNTKFLEVEY